MISDGVTFFWIKCKEPRGPGLAPAGPAAPAYFVRPAPCGASPRYIFSGPGPGGAIAPAELTTRPWPWQGLCPLNFMAPPLEWRGPRPGKILRPRPPLSLKNCLIKQLMSIIQYFFTRKMKSAKKHFFVFFSLVENIFFPNFFIKFSRAVWSFHLHTFGFFSRVYFFFSSRN